MSEDADMVGQRRMLFLELHGEDFVAVDHVWIPDGVAGQCPGCGEQEHDAGAVGITLSASTSGRPVTASVVLAPGQALLLAKGIDRTVDAIMAEREEPPDVDREAARLAASLRERP